MKEDQRVKLTKRLLRESLIKLIKKKDFNKISVTELCEASGINRATFYRHYQQPRDILSEIRNELFSNVKLISEKENAKTDTLKWLESICKHFHEHSEFLKILFTCRTEDEFVSFINTLFNKHLILVRNAGYGAELDDNELKLATYCFTGGIFYVLRQWILEPIDKSPKEIAKILYRLLPVHSDTAKDNKI